jgi:hypothetical protein
MRLLIFKNIHYIYVLGKPYNNLLDWKSVQKSFPWDVILLSGGSLAMADGFMVLFFALILIKFRN